MGAGLGMVSSGKQVFMVVTFTGEITQTQAETLNRRLNELLKDFNDNIANLTGGFGHVDHNNVDEGAASWNE